MNDAQVLRIPELGKLYSAYQGNQQDDLQLRLCLEFQFQTMTQQEPSFIRIGPVAFAAW
jgi:hypothetical protein